MTAQIPDSITYEGRAFSLVGINGSGLFEPQSIGLEVQTISTACYRGYYCKYRVKDSELVLERLYVGFCEDDYRLAESGKGPVRFGTRPTRDTFDYEDIHGNKGTDWDDWYYDQCMHPVRYTGGILIADEFIPEMYVHMGFHPAYKYRMVHELTFENGRMLSAIDCSAKMAEFREMIKGKPLSPTDPNDRKAIESWVKTAFNLSYKM